MLLDDKTVGVCDDAIRAIHRGMPDQAVQIFTDLLVENDKIALAWCNRGLALMQLGHPFDALLNIEKAIELEPKCGEYWNNLGAAYRDFEQTDKAIDAFNKANELNPYIAASHMNLGNALRYQGKLQEALVAYRKSLEVDPNMADGHLNYAFAALLAGEMEVGWEEFEWRWRCEQMSPRGLRIKHWQGEDLKGKTILLYGEQGLGDQLQFIRYAKLVREKYDCKVYVEVRYQLRRVAETVPGIDKLFTYGELIPVQEIDYQVAMMSVPRFMGTTVATIPWYGPYFTADPHRVAYWRKALQALPPGLLVGICWAGQSRPTRPNADRIDQLRSLSLSAFAPVARVQGVSWVSLQKGIPRPQIEKPPTGMVIGDWSELLDDFYDTAALIECLDLVITVDTAVVHMAGALGKPVWMLSRWDSCWRWMGDRPDSPWYPSLRQFCQPAPHAWDPVMVSVAEALREQVSQHRVSVAA